MNAASMNHVIAKSMNTVKFNVGDRFIATIKAVHAEGVNIVMPGGRGSGVISPKCWGDGARRKAALAALRPGDELPVVVVKFHPQTTTLSLVLDGGCVKPSHCGVVKPKPQKPARIKFQAARIQRKPDYTPIAAGTTFLVDGANLTGDYGATDAAHILRSVREGFEALGYKVVLFLEHRAYTWLKYNQKSEAKKSAFVRFVEKGGVSLVNGGEADLVILQCARQIPGSACVSDDGFADYKKVFGDIVGTPRVRRFTWTEIGGRRLLSIDGLADAIEIRQEEEAEVPVEKVAERHQRPDAPQGNDAVLALGNSMLAKGDTKKAFTCFEQAVRKGSSEGYRAMARAYETGDGVEKDAKKAAKFSKLAVKMERKARDCGRRLARKYAMVRDGAVTLMHDHMSVRDITACSLLARRRLNNDIRTHRRAKRISRNAVHSRAA